MQCDAVRNAVGEISVPLQRKSGPRHSGSQSANSAPTLGWVFPSSWPKVMAPAEGAKTRHAAHGRERHELLHPPKVGAVARPST